MTADGSLSPAGAGLSEEERRRVEKARRWMAGRPLSVQETAQYRAMRALVGVLDAHFPAPVGDREGPARSGGEDG